MDVRNSAVKLCGIPAQFFQLEIFFPFDREA